MDARTNKETQAQATGKQRATIRQSVGRFLLNRHFALLWTASTVSSSGSEITGRGLPVVAFFLLHASNEQMALLAALATLPGLLMGVGVDRLPRRPILLLADLGRAALLALMPLLALLGLLHLVWLSAVTVLLGLLTAGFEIACLSFVPALLAPDDLAAGKSRLGTSSSLAEIAGPPMAGLLVSLLTAPVAIVLDMLSFLFSALWISLMRVPEPLRAASPERAPVWREMREGLRVLWSNPILRATAGSIWTHHFFAGAYAALRMKAVSREYPRLQCSCRTWGNWCARGLVLFWLLCAPFRFWENAGWLGPVLWHALLLHTARCRTVPPGLRADGPGPTQR